MAQLLLFSRFYFPGGKPTPLSQVEATISRITAAFHSLPGHRASRSQFHTITKVCRVFTTLAGQKKTVTIVARSLSLLTYSLQI